MKFSCLVSRSTTRRPLPLTFVATDEAEATFLAWLDARVSTRTPTVRRAGPAAWVATDGHQVIKVQILHRQ